MILLMEEILHQLIGSLSQYSQGFNTFYTSQVVQDFLHQEYHIHFSQNNHVQPV